MQASERKKSVSHSNVLAPEHRSKEGACRILSELFARALKRLRAYDLAATAVQITVRYRKPRGGRGASLPFVSSQGLWTRRSRRHLPANDEGTWLKVLRPLLEAVPNAGAPSVFLLSLSQSSPVFGGRPLFTEISRNSSRPHESLSHTIPPFFTALCHKGELPHEARSLAVSRRLAADAGTGQRVRPGFARASSDDLPGTPHQS